MLWFSLLLISFMRSSPECSCCSRRCVPSPGGRTGCCSHSQHPLPHFTHPIRKQPFLSRVQGSQFGVSAREKPLKVSLQISWLQMVGLGFKITDFCCTLMNLAWTVPLLALKEIREEGKCFDPWRGEGALGWAVKTFCCRTYSVTSLPRWSCSPWPLLVQEVQRSNNVCLPKARGSWLPAGWFSLSSRSDDLSLCCLFSLIEYFINYRDFCIIFIFLSASLYDQDSLEWAN